MTPIIYLENLGTVKSIQYDPHESCFVLQSSKPLAYNQGVHKIPIKAKLNVPVGFFFVVENFSENLLNGNTVLKYDIKQNSIIVKVENTFIVPQQYPLCKLRLLNTTAFDIRTF